MTAFMTAENGFYKTNKSKKTLHFKTKIAFFREIELHSCQGVVFRGEKWFNFN